MVDLYTVMTYYFADAMEKVDRVAEDKGLKESLGRYAIEPGAIMEQVYRKKMEVPIENMKRFLYGIIHIHDPSNFCRFCTVHRRTRPYDEGLDAALRLSYRMR